METTKQNEVFLWTLTLIMSVGLKLKIYKTKYIIYYANKYKSYLVWKRHVIATFLNVIEYRGQNNQYNISGSMRQFVIEMSGKLDWIIFLFTNIETYSILYQMQNRHAFTPWWWSIHSFYEVPFDSRSRIWT